MKCYSSGSAVLIILLLTSSVLLYVSTVYRTTIAYADVLFQYREAQQQRWYAQGVLNWGIFVAKTEFNALVDYLATHSHIEVNLQLSDTQPKGQLGTLTISKIDDMMLLFKAYATNHRTNCCITSHIKKVHIDGQKPSYTVLDWRIGE